MWIRLLATLLLMGCHVLSAAQAREIVLAFDDTLGRSTSLDGTARTKMLVNSLLRVNVKQAMFLVSTRNITAKTLDSMLYYDEMGQLIINAGNRYSMLRRTKSYAYPIDIMKANAALLPYNNYHQHISYPYLHAGGNPEILLQLQNFLTDHNYLPTYVTTQVHDDYMNQLYQQRIDSGRTVDIRALEKAYVNMIVDKVLAYDGIAYLRLGDSPRQVLLLRENDLAAYCIVGLVDALNEHGFSVIAPEKVFTDPILNPYFSVGFKENYFIRALIGLPNAQPWRPYVAAKQDEEKIHAYLIDQGLEGMIPQ